MEGITRREALATAGAAITLSCLLDACQNPDKAKPPLVTAGTVNVGPAVDYPAGTANGKYLAAYGIFIANDSGTPVAVRAKCTHMGCTVAWKAADRGYECPCHHSRFNLLGLPLVGPATRPLPAIACVPQPDGTLTVDLTKLNGQ